MIIDVNVSLGFWPFQRFQIQTPAQLDVHLAAMGIGQAWVSAVESVLCPDLEFYDARLQRRLRPYRRLRMVKTLNPLLANWRQSVRLAARQGIRAVKVYPNYHLYSLASPPAREMAQELSRLGLTLLVQMRLEDERGMYPAMHVAGVAVDEVVSFAASVPRLPIIALCPYLAEARQLARRTRSLCVDLAHIEAPDTVKTALSDIPADRLMFGSHTPFLCTNAEVMKLQSANVAARDLRRVAEGNARRALSKHRLDVL